MPPRSSGSSSDAGLVREPGVRDAASLVIIKDDDDGTVSVLMGRRHPDTAFLPNKYVFPGGRFEQSDTDVSPARTLSPQAQNHLMVSVPGDTHPATMHALALTAIRETFEETGVVIGSPLQTSAPAPPSNWQSFFDTGHRTRTPQGSIFLPVPSPLPDERAGMTRGFFMSQKNRSAHMSSQLIMNLMILAGSLWKMRKPATLPASRTTFWLTSHA